MHTTNLRKVGDLIMLAVPPAILEILCLEVGTQVELAVDGERIVVNSRPKPRYTMDELLAQCDASVPISEEDMAWINLSPVGGEL